MGVWPKFHSKAFLKIHEYASADDFEGKKRFIVKWSTVADFWYAGSYVYFYRGVTEENEVALSLFCNFGIFSQDQFCL